MISITQTNESELVSKAQHGDRNAFSELVRTHVHRVFSVVYRMCGDRQLAEDAAQEAFIQAWLRMKSYRPQSSFRNWLYRIAVNTAIDMLRKEKRILPDAVETLKLVDKSLGPEPIVVNTERTEAIRNAVVGLPDASRAVLVLREYEGLSYKEIAEALDIPVGTVMSRLNYARKLLREKLEVSLFQFAEAANV